MTGVTLSNEDKGVIPIIRNRTAEKGLIVEYRIIQMSKASPEFDMSNAGTLKIPESQAMLTQTPSIPELNSLQDAVGTGPFPS
ncbi:hypothetical protein BS47DRAFT_1349079 [Hydnum rufescens UP504]|uniref:Uncharacterized protein n=1 Tax=Hydnum rufescens UP504 TaxID=1448309 RepID=A0A9P6DQ33_9AGAM|nr:hypothetical protein BS47DRAFT_1352273 [Hydnum rufescens UP504]KAF9509550.1 hypothetical protein BS47DRAFT_1349079 [Hydnum rufescens UP504]